MTGEKIYLEAGTAYAEASEKCLTMGTVLELVSETDERIMNRLPWNNYVVKMPHRNADGSFSQKKVLIPANRDVHVGYLDMTRAEIIRQAFKCLGYRYGWGGMLNSQDCSGYIRDVYSCFGLDIPRNTTWQAAMPVQVTKLNELTNAEKTFRMDAADMDEAQRFAAFIKRKNPSCVMNIDTKGNGSLQELGAGIR